MPGFVFSGTAFRTDEQRVVFGDKADLNFDAIHSGKQAMSMIRAAVLMGLLVSPTAHAALNCADTATSQPLSLRPTVLAPVAGEFTAVSSQLGAPRGVLAQGFDESQSVEQVLLRLRVESCHNTASLPAPGAARPNDPAAYKPKTAFDNTPYRFNMTQGGKRMTADDFDAWLKANGYSVGRRVDTATPAAAAPVAAPAAEPPAAGKKKK